MCCVLYKFYASRMIYVRWLPVIAEILLMLWTYYVYVICLCYYSSGVLVEAVCLLVAYHGLLGLTLWCHFMAVTSRPLTPPLQFQYDDAQWSKLNNDFLWIKRREEMEDLRLRLGIKTVQASMGRGLLVYCQQCKVIKPDRCHHCSRCGVCVLKMDHHCPWINNCVGFHNYKYFLLFIVYCLAYCIFVPLTSLRFVIAFFVDIYNGLDVSGDSHRIQIIVMFLFLTITGLALVPLLKLHWTLVSMNITTLENTRPLGLIGQAPDMRIFDMGRAANLRQVFGDRKLLWFFPVFTSMGVGSHFPLRDEFLLGKAGDLNKNQDCFLRVEDAGFYANREDTVLARDRKNEKTDAGLERNSKDENRTENSDYFYSTGH